MGTEGGQDMPLTTHRVPTTGSREPSFAAAAFANYHQELHRFLQRRIARGQDLADAMQEVYLRIVRVDKAELVRTPLAYIYGVASNVASELRMRAHNERVLFDSQTAETMAETPRHTAVDELGGLTERQVEEALGELIPNRLAVLLLERRDGLSLEQIAQKLGLSVHTVKKYSVEALAHVRASLER